MLKFESVFWASKDPSTLIKKLSALGFTMQASKRDSHCQSVYFGPESIEVFGAADSLVLGDTSSVSSFLGQGDGVYGIGLESRHIGEDYHRLKKNMKLGEPRAAKDENSGIPLWYGFSLPDISGLKAWVVTNSPKELQWQGQETLPLRHPNSCFGIEGIHFVSRNPKEAIHSVAKIVDRQDAGFQFNEFVKADGHRVQAGDRFMDAIHLNNDAVGEMTRGQERIYMVTLRVADLELAKSMAIKAGAKVIPCQTRDGFIISHEFTGGPAIRLVRHFWKRYLPEVSEFYPLGRRTDKFRPLGGANSTSLKKGFEDDWSF
jgi:hypothetical protein